MYAIRSYYVQIFRVAENRPRYRIDADFQQQREAGMQGVDTQQILAAAFEATGIRCRLHPQALHEGGDARNNFV